MVATARKPAFLVGHLLRKDEDYAWVRPGLYAKKLRSLELRAGLLSRRGQRGAASGYNLGATREEEKRRAERAEGAYRKLTEG